MYVLYATTITFDWWQPEVWSQYVQVRFFGNWNFHSDTHIEIKQNCDIFLQFIAFQRDDGGNPYFTPHHTPPSQTHARSHSSTQFDHHMSHCLEVIPREYQKTASLCDTIIFIDSWRICFISAARQYLSSPSLPTGHLALYTSHLRQPVIRHITVTANTTDCRCHKMYLPTHTTLKTT